MDKTFEPVSSLRIPSSQHVVDVHVINSTIRIRVLWRLFVKDPILGLNAAMLHPCISYSAPDEMLPECWYSVHIIERGIQLDRNGSCKLTLLPFSYHLPTAQGRGVQRLSDSSS